MSSLFLGLNSWYFTRQILSQILYCGRTFLNGCVSFEQERYGPFLFLLVVDVDRADAVLDVPGDVADDARVHRHHTRAPVGVARELAEHAVRRRDVLAYSEAQFNTKMLAQVIACKTTWV